MNILKHQCRVSSGYHIILVEDKQTGVNLLDDSEKYASILSSIYNNGLNVLADNLYNAADEKGQNKNFD